MSLNRTSRELAQQYLGGGVCAILCSYEIHLLLMSLSACRTDREVADVVSSCPPLLYALNEVVSLTQYEGRSVIGLYRIVETLGVDYITTFVEGLFDTAVTFDWTDELWAERKRSSESARLISVLTSQLVHRALDRDVARSLGSLSKLGSYVATTLLATHQLTISPTLHAEEIERLNYTVAQEEFGIDVHAGYRFAPGDHHYISYGKACAFAYALSLVKNAPSAKYDQSGVR